ncbi:hypothetical protein NIES4102_06850 [Chondrocystis sp. NIES-4102]|nr:hypothetical protein NIES4102_06850 [Chondrocystis sp. NIES-4102]
MIAQDDLPVTQEIIPAQPDNIDNPLIERVEIIGNNYNFPLNTCGDRDPGGENTWYPVYIHDTPENLNLVRSNYCKDAFRKYRTIEQIKSIQVASFTNEFKAREFAQLMELYLGSGEVGKSARYNFDNSH